MADITMTIAGLEREWDFDSGFFGLLRRGAFETQTFSRLVQTLNLIELPNDQVINRRVVALLWYMPLFMACVEVIWLGQGKGQGKGDRSNSFGADLGQAAAILEVARQ